MSANVLLAEPESLPESIALSRPLAEAHRLDLALFVVFEDVSVHVAETMERHAPEPAALRLAQDQARDDRQHLDQFGRRLDLTLAVSRPDRAAVTESLLLRMLQGSETSAEPLRRDEVCSAVIVPPLRRFLDRCRAAADGGAFLQALTLLDLVFKGMACPLYNFEACYWQPIDPFLAHLIRAAGADEVRHVNRAIALVASLSPAQRTELSRLCVEVSAGLRDAFRYYIRKLVGLFAVILRQQSDRYARAEIVPGRPLLSTSQEEQTSSIRSASEAGFLQVLRQAGLDDGQQEPIPHQ